MNRFEYGLGILLDDESVVSKDRGIKIYDGDEKVCMDARLANVSLIIAVLFPYRQTTRMVKLC